MEKEKLEEYKILIKEHILKIKDIRYWYKYTNNKIFSQRENGMFYEIRRGKSLIFYKPGENNPLYKINITKLISKILNELDEDNEYYKIYIKINDEIKEFLNHISNIMEYHNPLIKEIFNIPKFNETKEIVIFSKNKDYARIFNSDEELEDHLDDKIENISKIKIDDIEYKRDDFLSEEYRKYEYDKLIENEEYELLSFITKSQK